MQKYTERLGSAPLASLLVKLSLPGMAATIAVSLYNFVGILITGKVTLKSIKEEYPCESEY